MAALNTLKDLAEMLVYFIMVGVVVAAWLPAFIMNKVFNIGEHPIISTVIGSVVGLVLLFVLKINVSWYYYIALAAAAVVSIVCSIVQDKIL